MSFSKSNRCDLHAIKLESEATNFEVKGARNQLKQDISLAFGIGYNGQHNGIKASDYFSSLYSNVPGANISATLSYKFAFHNHGEQGLLVQSIARYEKNVVTQVQIEQEIEQKTSLAVRDIEVTIKSLQASQKSVELYRKVYIAELKKYKMGLSNLFELQKVSDDLTSAEKQLLETEKAYALSLVDLRYQIGALFNQKDGVQSVTMEHFTTLPQF